MKQKIQDLLEEYRECFHCIMICEEGIETCTMCQGDRKTMDEIEEEIINLVMK